MNETVTIPRVEYDRLCALEEDFADIKAALAVEARIASGEEELIPAGIVDRLIDGEPPLRVWREFRNLTQADFARASGVNRVQDRGDRGRSKHRIGSHLAQAGRCPGRRRGRHHPESGRRRPLMGHEYSPHSIWVKTLC